MKIYKILINALIACSIYNTANAYSGPNHFQLQLQPKEILQPMSQSLIGLKMEKEGFWGGYFTATAVALDGSTILTAAHNLYNKKGEVIKLSNLRLYSVVNNSKYSLKEKDGVVIIPSAYTADPTNMHGSANDIAIIKLNSDLFKSNNLIDSSINIAGNEASYYDKFFSISKLIGSPIYGFGWGSSYKEGGNIENAGHFACQGLSDDGKTENRLRIGKFIPDFTKICPSLNEMLVDGGDSGGPLYIGYSDKTGKQIMELFAIAVSSDRKSLSDYAILINNPAWEEIYKKSKIIKVAQATKNFW